MPAVSAPASLAAVQSRAGSRFDPLLLLWVALAAILAFLVINPLLRLVMTSLQEADTGTFTLQNYVAAYGRPRYVQALYNSLMLGAA